MFYVTRTVLVELAISNQSFRKTTGARSSNNVHKEPIYFSITLTAITS
jgi:hypothetical protein